MKVLRQFTAAAIAALLLTPATFAANHREAPITALDRLADITDFFAFVSYDNANKVTFLLNVDPLLEPANGPTYFPFDPEILYEINVDNNKDAVPDVKFQFRFTTEYRAPGVFTAYVGAGNGLSAPANSPAPVPPGTPLVPPAITALDGPGSEGLNLRQKYTVTMVKGGVSTVLTTGVIVAPANAGPRTMPNYPALAAQAIKVVNAGVKVFAGTVDDPFYLDLGAAFDTLNLRTLPNGSGIPGVLSNLQEMDDTKNFAPDMVSGFNVNTIAIEVPITMVSRLGNKPAAGDPDATLGAFGSTSRPRLTVRRSPDPQQSSGDFRQVQRMGNPLINELLIGIGSKDKFSMSQPKDDAQFANFLLDPLLPRALNAIYTSNLPIPAAPRTDLLPLVTYAPPLVPMGSPAGPVADLLRLNTSIPPTPKAMRKRIAFLAGDSAGFPNGRRVSDDVADISLRAVAGILTGLPQFTGFPHNRLGDGVNTNDKVYQETFPYVAFSQDGRNRRHVDPGEDGLPVN